MVELVCDLFDDTAYCNYWRIFFVLYPHKKKAKREEINSLIKQIVFLLNNFIWLFYCFSIIITKSDENMYWFWLS